MGYGQDASPHNTAKSKLSYFSRRFSEAYDM